VNAPLDVGNQWASDMPPPKKPQTEYGCREDQETENPSVHRAVAGMANADEKVVSPPQNPVSRMERRCASPTTTRRYATSPAIPQPMALAPTVAHGLMVGL